MLMKSYLFIIPQKRVNWDFGLWKLCGIFLNFETFSKKTVAKKKPTAYIYSNYLERAGFSIQTPQVIIFSQSAMVILALIKPCLVEASPSFTGRLTEGEAFFLLGVNIIWKVNLLIRIFRLMKIGLEKR